MTTVGYVRVSTDKAGRTRNIAGRAGGRRSAPWLWCRASNSSTRPLSRKANPLRKPLRLCNRPAASEVAGHGGCGQRSERRHRGMAKLDRPNPQRQGSLQRRTAGTLRRHGVALVSVAESLDTGSAAGRLVLNIMAAVSQWEREAIGERIRVALQHKRSQGQRVGNIATRAMPSSRQRWTAPRTGSCRAGGSGGNPAVALRGRGAAGGSPPPSTTRPFEPAGVRTRRLGSVARSPAGTGSAPWRAAKRRS